MEGGDGSAVDEDVLSTSVLEALRLGHMESQHVAGIHRHLPYLNRPDARPEGPYQPFARVEDHRDRQIHPSLRKNNLEMFSEVIDDAMRCVWLLTVLLYHFFVR